MARPELFLAVVTIYTTLSPANHPRNEAFAQGKERADGAQIDAVRNWDEHLHSGGGQISWYFFHRGMILSSSIVTILRQALMVERQFGRQSHFKRV